ncbi:hypothetical protein ACC689_35010, partial [Rhizobium ruizarguesonis]
VGAVDTSALIQYGPFPMHLIYALLLVAFTLQAAFIWLTHETGGTRPGALGSLIPRVTIPKQVKRPLSLVTPKSAMATISSTRAKKITGLRP